MSRPQNPLSDALRGFGHIKVAARIVAYDLLSKAPDFLPDLLTACRVAETEIAATWLLKYHIETTDLHLGPTLQHDFYDSVLQVSHWEAKLHALQIMDRVPLPGNPPQTRHRLCDSGDKGGQKVAEGMGILRIGAGGVPTSRPAANSFVRFA